MICNLNLPGRAHGVIGQRAQNLRPCASSCCFHCSQYAAPSKRLLGLAITAIPAHFSTANHLSRRQRQAAPGKIAFNRRPAQAASATAITGVFIAPSRRTMPPATGCAAIRSAIFPKTLERACLETVKARWFARLRDPLAKSEQVQGVAWVQTSLDQGQTWVDIFCAAFTTAAGFKIVNLSGLTPRTTVLAPTDAGLADDTVVDGALGDRLRLKITSTGTFGSGSVSQGEIIQRTAPCTR